MSDPTLVRKAMATCFPLGALGHVWWVLKHGLLYHGPAPSWAVWFWYGLCVVDVVVCLLLLVRPRAGLVLAVATMAVSLMVNWTCFPTFEYGFNWVLVGLTVFGAWVFAVTPWLWQTIRNTTRTTSRGCAG